MIHVSVITVCLNAAQHIEGALRSAMEQTYPDLELVVIDGGSTDGTLDIIERYRDRIGYCVSEPDKGLYDAMNKGARAASGDVLFFLNADDHFHDPDVVADVAEVFRNEPELELVYGDVVLDMPGGWQLPHSSLPALTRRALCRTTVCHQTIFARKSLFERVGFFSTEDRIVGDFDWLYRAAIPGGARARHVERNIAVIGTGGLSHATDWGPEKRRVLRRYYSPTEIFFWRVIFKRTARIRRFASEFWPIRWSLYLVRMAVNPRLRADWLARRQGRRLNRYRKHW